MPISKEARAGLRYIIPKILRYGAVAFTRKGPESAASSPVSLIQFDRSGKA